MSEKPPSSRNDPRYNLLLIGLWLFAAWAVARNSVRMIVALRGELLGVRTDIVDRDFANYWVGGKLVHSGQTDLLFHHEQYFATLKLLFGEDYQIHSWSYPPHFLMVVAPLGWLDYLPALGVFLAATLALFAWGTREFARRFAPGVGTGRLWLMLAGFVLAMIEATQNGFLTSAFLLVALAFMRDRPVLAGCALALLTMKPQLGFLLPLLALYDRNWPLLRWATIFTIGLVATSIALFGADSWVAYFENVIPYQNFVMMHWEGGFLWFMPSLFGSGRVLGMTAPAAFAAHAVLAVVALVALLRLLGTLRDPLERAFAVLAATLLITPYSFNYDMGAFCVAAACLAWRAHACGQAARSWIFAAAATLPAYMSWLAWKHVPLSPLLIGAAFASLWVVPRPAVPAGAGAAD